MKLVDNYKYINTTGVIAPDTSDLQTEVTDEYLFAFGEDLITTPDTPQGVLITNETLARSELVRNNAQLANQINPHEAGGIFLDAIMMLFNLSRVSDAPTVVPGVQLNGVAGTVVSEEFTAANTNGDLFSPVSEITLNGSGVATANFQALVSGPIEVGVGMLTTIVNGVLGVETVTNPTAGILGRTAQSDENAKLLRDNTLAKQGTGFAEALISRLLLTVGVTSVTVRENVSGMTQVIDGVTMVGHSVYICVAGGTDTDVAQTITDVKGGGCNYNNGPGINKSIPITNPRSLQTINVLFDRPNLKPIQVRITISVNNTVTDPTTAVKQAILDYANGLIDGETGFTIGTDVSCFELAGAVNQEVPGIFVTNVETKLVASGSFSNATLPIAIFEQATVSLSAISVVIS